MQSRKISGIRLREIREDRELTTTQLAALMSADLGNPVHQSTISKYENGHRQPRPRTFGALCRILRVEKAELLLPVERDKAAS